MGPPHSSSPASNTTLSPRYIAAVLCIIHHVPHRLGLTAFTFRAWFLIYRQEEGGVYLGSGMANGPRLRFSTTIMAIKVREFHYCETALLDYQTDYWTLLGENTLHDPNISERNGLKFMSAHFMVRLTQKHCPLWQTPLEHWSASILGCLKCCSLVYCSLEIGWSEIFLVGSKHPGRCPSLRFTAA